MKNWNLKKKVKWLQFWDRNLKFSILKIKEIFSTKVQKLSQRQKLRAYGTSSKTTKLKTFREKFLKVEIGTIQNTKEIPFHLRVKTTKWWNFKLLQIIQFQTWLLEEDKIKRNWRAFRPKIWLNFLNLNFWSNFFRSKISKFLVKKF